MQPAEIVFDAAEIHGLTPEERRRGIKNPLAIMASLEAWVPGAVVIISRARDAEHARRDAQVIDGSSAILKGQLTN